MPNLGTDTIGGSSGTLSANYQVALGPYVCSQTGPLTHIYIYSTGTASGARFAVYSDASVFG